MLRPFDDILKMLHVTPASKLCVKIRRNHGSTCETFWLVFRVLPQGEEGHLVARIRFAEAKPKVPFELNSRMRDRFPHRIKC
jgi:hypothetical protein